MRWLRIACAGLAASVVSADPFVQGVYVWQRDQGPAVERAIGFTGRDVFNFEVLAAEARWTANGGKVTWVQPSEALKETRLGIGLVVRIGPLSGTPPGFEAFAESVCRQALERAKARGFEISELQIDFDCAEGRLPAYASWLSRVHDALAPMPVIFTALPVWLGHRSDFAALAAAADGYVLQVHSLERPSGPDRPFTLCDTQKARQWATEASTFGRPFRIALPTYGYRVGFDPKGTFIGLEAEGSRVDWPKGTTVRAVFSDPDELAHLVRDWLAERPQHCQGLLWFRMPVAGDSLTWAPETWREVMGGNEPASKLEVQTSVSAGLIDVSVVNRGERSELPAEVRLSWPAGEQPLASDAFGGFVLESHPAQSEEILIAARLAEGDRLAPGQRRPIAWIRFSHDVHVVATLAQPH